MPSVAPPTFPPLVTPSGQAPATFTLHPSIGLTEEYTDNFNLTPRNQVSNFRTLLNLGANLLINGARTQGQISANYAPSYDSSNGEFSGDRSASLAGQVRYEVSPLFHVLVADTLTLSDEPGLADQLSLRQTRQVFFSNLFYANADYRLETYDLLGYYQLSTFFQDAGANTISNTVGGSVTKSFLRTNFASIGYEFLQSDTSDGGDDITQNQVNATVSRQLNEFTSAGLTGSYTLATVSNERNLNSLSDFTLTSVSVFANYAVPGIWTVNASIGYSYFDPDRGKTHSTPTTSTTISYQLARATLTLAVDAGYSETYQTGQNFGVIPTWGVRGSVSYPLTSLITGSIAGFYRQNRFILGMSTGELPHTEDVWGGTVSVSIPLRQRFSLVLQYGYTSWTSTLPNQDYTENRASASLAATF